MATWLLSFHFMSPVPTTICDYWHSGSAVSLQPATSNHSLAFKLRWFDHINFLSKESWLASYNVFLGWPAPNFPQCCHRFWKIIGNALWKIYFILFIFMFKIIFKFILKIYLTLKNIIILKINYFDIFYEKYLWKIPYTTNITDRLIWQWNISLYLNWYIYNFYFMNFSKI